MKPRLSSLISVVVSSMIDSQNTHKCRSSALNILKKIICFAILATLPSFAAAQELRIGVVNPNRLLEEAPQSKLALKRLEQEFTTRDGKLMKEQKSIKGLEDKLGRDGAVMAEAERRKLERDIVSRKRELRRGYDELREDRTFRSNEERGKLLRFVNEAITKIGKEEKFDLILYEGIAYADPKVDLTKKILKRLQAEAKAGK